VPVGNPFVVEQTRDINCKNKKGLTALQIVISKLIAAGEEERREECVKKLDILLRMEADITVVKPSSLQAALCILEAGYSQEESIINRLNVQNRLNANRMWPAYLSFPKACYFKNY